ncbi:DUF2333 family protein [Pseudaquidulcibacter saccharophilus]|uniref:DUF2333 family protein n=1 Tax=Pseudaquidulcibacter saccharophilus TaxID=2831900 RepID=UPI001EFF043A|nr:DUF2333 family protein [Pseudaquidulcibacter saccharophilus]
MDIGQSMRLLGAKVRGLFTAKPKTDPFSGSDVPPAQLAPDAEPKKKKKSWKTILVLVLVLGIIPAYYFLGAVFTHRINDQLNYKVPAPSNGKSTTVEVIAGLIDREVNKTKWAPNVQPFEPAAMLRFGGNMVNFQSGLIRALSTTVYEMENRLARTRGTSQADVDMAAARQGLSRSPETWILDPLPTSSADHEYRKAREALIRYNNRLASGQAVFEVRADNLQGVLDHIALDLGGVSDSLDKQMDDGRKVFIDRRADKLFYYAKGEAYGYFIVLRALREDYGSVLQQRGVDKLYSEMLTELAMAAQMRPPIVQNAAPDALLIPNHLAMEGFYILRARAKLREITAVLQN